MACYVLIQTLSLEKRAQLHNDLTIVPEEKKDKKKKVYAKEEPICGYIIEGATRVLVPFAYYYKTIAPPVALTLIQQPRVTVLREEQLNVFRQALETLLTKKSILLSLYTGFGKTVLAISLAKVLGVRTLVIVSRLILIEQWVNSVVAFWPECTVQVLTAKTATLDDSAQICIVNAINLPKIALSLNLRYHIKCAIVDECHLILAKVLGASLFCLSPQFLIGLSATPYRLDGYDAFFSLFFGDVVIEKKLQRSFVANVIHTGHVIPSTYTAQGTLNWSAVIDFQARIAQRNALIVSIVASFNTYSFLVIAKRVAQAKDITAALEQQGVAVACLTGSQKVDLSTSSYRVIVGCHGKLGTGFDYPCLNALILATDVRDYFVQIIGRIFRSPRVDSVPLVFDLVDDHSVLKKHFKDRCVIYKEIGGIVQEFDITKLVKII